jgi:hypothetical protein
VVNALRLIDSNGKSDFQKKSRHSGIWMPSNQVCFLLLKKATILSPRNRSFPCFCQNDNGKLSGIVLFYGELGYHASVCVLYFTQRQNKYAN